ncbi:hypothetical protein [Flavobacterium sp. LB2R40]|uniref:hypothetical protein n=1 Tax=unclassified Flavobacterium TaxID=196869 RepID=UPI003AAEB884
MNQKLQEDLSHIRSMMERSSRFISLSGLSGVFAGLFALAGSIYAYQLFKNNGIEYFDGKQKIYSSDLIIDLVLIAFAILVFALGSGIFFTLRKSKKFDLPVWTNTTKKMVLNLAIPLMVGGIFCMALIYHQLFALIAPVTLLFYGLALINAGKYTFSDIRYLGTCEIILGCVSLFYLGFGLVFWAIGFGVLHILYGIIVFKKYK